MWVLKRAAAVAAPEPSPGFSANLTVRGVSLLARAASFLSPARPGDGRSHPHSVCPGVFANEIVIPIAMMSYIGMAEVGSLTTMGEILRVNGWTWMTALSVMLFSLLHYPCGTTVFTIFKETGSRKWALVSLVLPTLLAAGVLTVLNALFRLL